MIFKVLSKQATKQEIDELHGWINQSGDNREEYEDIKLLLENTQEETSYEKNDPFYDGLKGIKQAIRAQRKRKQAITLILIIAGIVILFLTLSYAPTTRQPISIRFVDVPLSDIPLIFSEKYKVNVKIPDNLLKCEFSGVLYQESATDALRIISESLDLTYSEIGSDSFVIVGNGCFEENKN